MADLAALNYTLLYPYNGSIPTGGDSLNADLNIFYTVGPRYMYSGMIVGQILTFS